MKIPKSFAILGGLLLLGTLAGRAVEQQAARKPNIIFILADDVGLDGIGCFGADRLKTPNIDALAKGGTRFEYNYACPLCGPSRSQFLTGRYPFRTGMTSNSTGNLLKPANEIMLPTVLKPAGYVTAQVGKWNQLPLQPSDWGFDEYLRFAGSGKYWREQEKTYTVNGQTVDLPEGKYLPDAMHEFLVDFLTRHKEQPFFVYYSMSHVHAKILRTPDSAPNSTNLYADNIAYMDKLVGKLVAELDRLGLRENTLLVFTGDNGTAPGPSRFGSVNSKTLSGRKGTMLEGGSRVPLIVNWPGLTPSGKICHDLTDFSDFFPTFVELAGAKLPTDRPIDGHSFLPQIKGETGTPREWIYVELAGKRYVADKRWKLNNSKELFDLKEAPFKEIFVPNDSTDSDAVAAREHLHGILDTLVGKEKASPSDSRNFLGRKNKKRGV